MFFKPKFRSRKYLSWNLNSLTLQNSYQPCVSKNFFQKKPQLLRSRAFLPVLLENTIFSMSLHAPNCFREGKFYGALLRA